MSKEQPLVVDFVSYRKSVPELLDSIGAGEVLSEQARVLIKPNLINTSPPPVTTPGECCEAIIEYIRRCSEAEIIIGEGCGAPDYDTYVVFDHRAIIELNRYVTPNLTLLDARIGLSEYHLGGAECNPHVCKLIAGFNPLAVDRKAAELLGLNPDGIPHLAVERG